MSRPLLSICVPTLNRGGLLGLGLQNLLSEAEPFGDRVEVLVSDNASSDDTPDVLAGFGTRVRAFRQPETLIFPAHLVDMACRQAKGEFVFFMGDDDLLVRGSLKRIVDLLEAQPELDYVYLNVGWISVPGRNRAILEGDCRIPEVPGRRFQLKDRETRILPRLEDVLDLCDTSPYAMFSTIFCYVARRTLYLRQADQLQLSQDWDHATQPLDNMFPHAVLTLKACAGRPIGCIGEPAVLQGSWHQGWASWGHKSMVHGHYLLFEWLERETAFDRGALDRLWQELARYAGRMTAEMLDQPDRHLGLDVLRAGALPRLVALPGFLEAFRETSRRGLERDLEADRLESAVREAFGGRSALRLVLWNYGGCGERWLSRHPERLGQLVAVVDEQADFKGRQVAGSPLTIQPPEGLACLDFDGVVWAALPAPASDLQPWVPAGVPVVGRVGGQL